MPSRLFHRAFDLYVAGQCLDVIPCRPENLEPVFEMLALFDD
jgi:hypothetical protein